VSPVATAESVVPRLIDGAADGAGAALGWADGCAAEGDALGIAGADAPPLRSVRPHAPTRHAAMNSRLLKELVPGFDRCAHFLKSCCASSRKLRTNGSKTKGFWGRGISQGSPHLVDGRVGEALELLTWWRTTLTWGRKCRRDALAFLGLARDGDAGDRRGSEGSSFGRGCRS